jgi:hypothetical protein
MTNSLPEYAEIQDCEIKMISRQMHSKEINMKEKLSQEYGVGRGEVVTLVRSTGQ